MAERARAASISHSLVRGEKALTEAQKAEIIALSEKLGVPKDKVHFWSRNTSYGDTFDMVMIGTDIMPSVNPKSFGEPFQAVLNTAR